MSYSDVDPIIQGWAKARSLKLFTNFAGEQTRFCYISSAKGECFQISIEPPENGEISVHAWSIETIDDVEMHEEWKSRIDGLRATLEAALSEIEVWMKRP